MQMPTEQTKKETSFFKKLGLSIVKGIASIFAVALFLYVLGLYH